eukprot:TRINITY_DN24736_c0_g1_i1.p1 TRINITY_DN24736_c0_g1~~TRINITY_DN24736_c0_g1_i1.p1  ORF type:complete len:211 (+),score=35.61 TRINITY_DN24736_c0_g1_i1:46-678(+)
MSSEETIKKVSQLDIPKYDKSRIIAAAAETDVGVLVDGLCDDSELLSVTLNQFLKLRDESPARSPSRSPSEEKVTLEQLMNVQQLMDELLQRYRSLEKEHSELITSAAAKDKRIRELEYKLSRRENYPKISTPPATSVSPSVSPDKRLRRQETAQKEMALLESHSRLHSQGSPDPISTSPGPGWSFRKSPSSTTPSPSRRKPVSVRLRST